MTKKIISVLLSVFLLFMIAVPAFAESTTKTPTTIVTFVCKVDSSIETDDYNAVVVCIRNIKTHEKIEERLYKYNNFSERYEIPNGVYEIDASQTRIENRNDIIFEVVTDEQDEQFNIGYTKTVYFELYDSNLRATQTSTATTTTQASTTESTTEKKTLLTLVNLSNITEQSTNGENIDTTIFLPEEISDNTENSQLSDTETTAAPTQTTETTDEFSSVVAEDKAESGLKIIIVAASLIFLVIVTIITLILKKRRDDQ